jgi:anti-sigma factor RsiW
MSRVDDVMLMAYVDGEVDAATAREIEASLAVDPALAARAQRLRDSAAMTRAAYAEVLHEPVPDRLVAALGGKPQGPAEATPNVVKFAKPERPAAGTVPRRAVVSWAMAAGLAALIAGYGAGQYSHLLTPAPGEGIQLASSDRWLDHVAGFYNVYASSLATKDRLLVDFNAEDVPELEKWFGAKLNRKLAVPDLTARGFTAQGGRLLIINGKPAAQFLYYSATGELVGLVIAFSEAPYQPAQTDKRGNVNIVHWRNNGYAYAFAGTSPPERLQELADRVWKDLERAS